MTVVSHIYLFGALAAGIASQFLIKSRVSLLEAKSAGTGPFDFILLGLLDFGVWLAMALSFGAGLAWMLTLRHLDISYAYPWTAVSYIVVTVGGALFFHESISATQVLGLALICTGIVVSALGAAGQ